MIACGWAETSRFDLRLVGTEGSLVYDFNDAETLHHIDLNGQSKGLSVTTHDVRFARQMQAFADRVRGTAADEPVCDFAQGLASMELVFDAARAAAGSPKPAAAVVQIDPQVLADRSRSGTPQAV